MYNEADLVFYRMPRVYNEDLKGGEGAEVFEIETQLTLPEKIAFIDEIEYGVATYLLELHDKWLKEKDTLPQQYEGRPKTGSLQAWIRRNDELNMVAHTAGEYLGGYRLFGTQYNIQAHGLLTPKRYGHYLTYTDHHIGHQWFHGLCKVLARKEEVYFKERDPYHLKLQRVQKYTEQYGATFGDKVLADITWNPHRIEEHQLTEADLDRYLAAYARMDELVAKISVEWAFEAAREVRASEDEK